MIPGLDEIFSLTDVKRHVDSGRYDLLVIDCAPTAETLRLLSLPEAMNWYIERIFPVERRVVKTIRPLLSRLTSHADRRRPDLRRGRAAPPQPRRRAPAPDERADVVDPARGEPREDGDRRGPPDLHVPVAVRLPGRRGRREPDHPRRGRRPVLRQVEGDPGRAPGDGPRVVRSRCRSSPPGCSTGRWWARAARADGRGGVRRARRDGDPAPRGADPGPQAGRAPTCCRCGCRSWSGRTWTCSARARSCSCASARTSGT